MLKAFQAQRRDFVLVNATEKAASLMANFENIVYDHRNT